ncbi:MAG: DUF4397 domain-containing protein [Candidatus Kapabacteria bacterium]|nr:DUF4397 domain-containing protein [Candidatus Kapabacteria bacterium]
MQIRLAVLNIILAALLASCASEDPNILDPSPQTMKINLRFVNLVADGQSRRMVLERGVETPSVPPGQFAATVQAPLDSSYISVVAGDATEFKSFRRVTFIRNATANVVATGSGPADTAVLQTVILPLTGATAASIRVSNMTGDTTVTYDVRKGCPSGPSITPTSLRHRATSLYADVVPGQNVFSILERRGDAERTLGIIECNLAPYRPHVLLIYQQGGIADPQLLLLDESDTTTGAARPVVPVAERVAEVRVVNLTSATASVKLDASGQDVASNVAARSLSAFAEVPTCLSLAADRFTATMDDGRTATDSTIFSVRRRTSIVLADAGSDLRSIVVPPVEGVIPDGKARIRVVNADDSMHRVNISVGGRSSSSTANGISAGVTLARDLAFGSVSASLDIDAGPLPLTITTATTPTAMLHVTQSIVEAGREYVLIIGRQNGLLQTWLVRDDAQSNALAPTKDAAFLRFVNAIPGAETPRVDIVPPLDNGAVYYRNSVATSVPIGGTEIRVDGVEESVPTADGERTLVILTDRGGQRDVLSFMTPPLSVLPKQSERRILNATKDIAFVTVAYDSIPKKTPLAPKLASRVPYGEMSAVDRTTVDRRGTFYFYDDETLTELYKLPMSFTPLGNSATLIVVGSKEAGYDVIVLQEF